MNVIILALITFPAIKLMMLWLILHSLTIKWFALDALLKLSRLSWGSCLHLAHT